MLIDLVLLSDLYTCCSHIHLIQFKLCMFMLTYKISFKFLIIFRLSDCVCIEFIYKVPYLHACLLVVVLFLIVLFHLSNAAIFIVETSYIFSFSPFHTVLLYVVIQNSDSKFLLLFVIYLYHNWWVLAPVAVINSAFCCCSGNTSSFDGSRIDHP